MTEEKNECVPRLRFPEFTLPWTQVSLHTITNISSGLTNQQVNHITPYKVSRIETISSGSIDINKVGYTEYFNNIELFKLKVGDILFSNINSLLHIGKSAYINSDKNLYHGMNLLRLEITGYNISKFIFYYINTNNCRNSFRQRANKAVNQASINQTEVGKTTIYLPSPTEQRKIADCLSSLDELIETREQKCNALKQYKKGLMQHLFPAEGETTPRWRFPEFRDSGEWDLLTLASICHLQAGKFIAAEKIHTVWYEGLFPCYGGNGLRGYVEKSNCKKCYPLIGRQGALCGNIQMPDREFYATEHAIIAKCDELVSSNIFLFYMLSKLNLNNLAIGQAQPGISVEILKKVLIQHPSLPEQQKIADCLSSLDDRIAAEEERLAALREHKKGLMQQLFPRYE